MGGKHYPGQRHFSLQTYVKRKSSIRLGSHSTFAFAESALLTCSHAAKDVKEIGNSHKSNQCVMLIKHQLSNLQTCAWISKTVRRHDFLYLFIFFTIQIHLFESLDQKLTEHLKGLMCLTPTRPLVPKYFHLESYWFQSKPLINVVSLKHTTKTCG